MFAGFYSSLSGMQNFQTGLSNISNNLANMNSAGFKGNILQFSGMLGSGGSQITGQHYDFSQGDLRQTGNPLNAGIQGNGFFILQDDKNNTFYTRSGDFDIKEGFLVDRATGFKVMGFSESGALTPISISDFVTLDPQATTQINFTNQINVDQAERKFDITVFNSLGEEVKLDITLTKNPDPAQLRSFLIEVKDKDGNIVANSEVRFGTDTKVDPDFDDLQIVIPQSANGNAGEPLDLILNFGSTDDDSNGAIFTTSNATNMSVNIEDGRTRVGITQMSFEEDGTFKLEYSNGETLEPYTLGLANFNDSSVLQQIAGSVFRSADDSQASIGKAGTESFGDIKSERLEASNVDMVGQFAELLIVQRGYQASSQAMNIANEFIQQLYDRR